MYSTPASLTEWRGWEVCVGGEPGKDLCENARTIFWGGWETSPLKLGWEHSPPASWLLLGFLLGFGQQQIPDQQPVNTLQNQNQSQKKIQPHFPQINRY